MLGWRCGGVAEEGEEEEEETEPFTSVLVVSCVFCYVHPCCISKRINLSSMQVVSVGIEEKEGEVEEE